jgi:hydroxyethylthiazole kinase-like uncharacterized protein yjeF
MQRIPTAPATALPLHSAAATRLIEQAAAAALPAHTLMRRAGAAVAGLALALAPHARQIWVACGRGNNGGDGLEAAALLSASGKQVHVTWLGQTQSAPADALASWQRAREAGVLWCDGPPPLGPQDLCIDALLGLGVDHHPGQPSTRAPDPALQACLQALRQAPCTVLAVDLPSGLDADTGQYANTRLAQQGPDPVTQRHTLSLLTLKPGLFTGAGRDAAGQVWWHTLDADLAVAPPTAWLAAAPGLTVRAHASHKGSYGDVAVIGGEGLAPRGMGMGGAALLAASAALHHGAGRVLLHLLDAQAPSLDTQQPELMLRRFEALRLPELSVVCGCGGGEAVVPLLAQVLQQAPRLVLDADALNAVARDAALARQLAQRRAQGWHTVLTPHPLEAARLLGSSTATVQAQRLQAAQQLAERLQSTVVLKGSGSVVASPGTRAWINPTGNARLATAGTGDVLAGMVGARLAAGEHAEDAARHATFCHGLHADTWPEGLPLTASALARRG